MAEKIKILLVEDEFFMSQLLQTNLELAGYEICASVPTGEEAIEVIARARPDLVLMDVRLAGAMDGIQAAQEISARCAAPIVFMTGYSDQETRERAQELQPLAILIKPIGPREIMAVIDLLLRK